MKNAKRDRRAEVVREMIGKSMSYMGCFFCSFHFVLPYPPEASAGRPVFSVLLFFFFSFFFFSLLLPSAVRDIPSKKSVAHSRWRHRCAPSTLQSSPSSPFDSFHRFLLSLSCAGAFFFLPGSGDTQRGGELRTVGGGVESKTKRELKKIILIKTN